MLPAEGLTLESFKLLDESDLKELGFTLGPRKLLLRWFKEAESVDRNTLSDNVTSAPATLTIIPSTTAASASFIEQASSVARQTADTRPVFKVKIFGILHI